MAERDDDRPEAASAAREPVFNLPRVVVAVIALCVGVHLVRFYVLTDDQDFGWLVRTAFIPLRYSGQFDLEAYAFTSPLTYSFLHGGLAHLVINMVWLAAFGSPLANRLGAWRFALFWAATAALAAGFHYAVHPLDDLPLVGASGAISGMMGAAARFGFRVDRASGGPAFSGAVWRYRSVLSSRGVVAFLAAWMGLNLAAGLLGFGADLGQNIAWEAHIGGFAAGFFGIGLFVRHVHTPPGPPTRP